jgi:hypothetical protein
MIFKNRLFVQIIQMRSSKIFRMYVFFFCWCSSGFRICLSIAQQMTLVYRSELPQEEMKPICFSWTRVPGKSTEARVFCLIQSHYWESATFFNDSFLVFFRTNLFFVVVVLRFELRASHLLGRSCITWAMPLALFVLVILEIGSRWDDRHVLPHPAFFLKWGSHKLFARPGLELQSS